MSDCNEEDFSVVIYSDDRLFVTTSSSFYKPTFLGLNLEDSTNLVQNWIKNGRIVAFRWPDSNNSIWNTTNYLLPYNPNEHPIKTGKPIFFSSTYDEIHKFISSHPLNRKKSFNSITSQHNQSFNESVELARTIPNQPRVNQTSLLCNASQENGRKEGVKRKLSYEASDSHEVVLTELLPMTVTNKSTLNQLNFMPHGFGDELSIGHFDELHKENQRLRTEISRLESSNSKLLEDLQSSENKNTDLTEKLMQLEREQPVVLISELKEQILELREIIKTTKDRNLGMVSLTPTGSLTGSPLTRSSTKLVPLYGDIMISETALRRVKVAARTDGNSSTSINACISIILDTLYHTEELANMSLSGLPCPSIKGSVAKPKLPDDVRDAIRDFMIGLWDKLYKSILTEKQIRSAISTKFISCHSAVKIKASCRKKKSPKKKTTPSKTQAGSSSVISVNNQIEDIED